MSGTAYSSMNPPKAGTGFEKETRWNERAGRIPGASAGCQPGRDDPDLCGAVHGPDRELQEHPGIKYRLSIDGRNLRIRYYDKDEMEITGNIDAIGFDER